MLKKQSEHPRFRREERAYLRHWEVRRYYDEVYYKSSQLMCHAPFHLRRLAKRFEPWEGKRLLDVGCGAGGWLKATAEFGAIPTGIDISKVAIGVSQQGIPKAKLLCSSAENLPFDNDEFDFISCLGSLEHFLGPERALREMVRVAKSKATFLFLLPNSSFLPRRLGLFRGTEQVDIREDVRTLAGWQELFESAGLRVTRRWRDLHILSWSWIRQGKWHWWPLRAGQAMVLPFWPLSWQYQVYHLCEMK